MSTPAATPNALKKALRTTMRAHRNALAADARAEYSARIRERVLALLNDEKRLGAGKQIAIFLATPGEPNLDALIELLDAHGIRVLAPHFEDARFPFHEVRGDGSNIGEIEVGKIRVRAPRAAVGAGVLSAEAVNVVLLPGLAFDAIGNRLGQGGGWYDRVLAQAPHAVKIGVAFDFQIVESLPHEAHDQCMNFVVTENRVLKF